MYELMIHDATIANDTIVGTGVSLSILKCLKEFIDKHFEGKTLRPADILKYTIDNIGKFRLSFTIFIDGNWIP